MKTILAVLALTTLAASAQAADTWSVDKVHSDAAFQVRHLMSGVRGHFADFEGTIVTDAAQPESSSVEFKIKVASITTGVEKRDAHLRSGDFFDVEKYPEITFKSTAFKQTDKDNYAVTGDLTMRGVTKVITLPVTFLGVGKDPWGNERAGFETAVTLNRKDFGINWNQTLDQGGVLLGDDVKVMINIEAVKKPAAGAAK